MLPHPKSLTKCPRRFAQSSFKFTARIQSLVQTSFQQEKYCCSWGGGDSTWGQQLHLQKKTAKKVWPNIPDVLSKLCSGLTTWIRSFVRTSCHKKKTMLKTDRFHLVHEAVHKHTLQTQRNSSTRFYVRTKTHSQRNLPHQIRLKHFVWVTACHHLRSHLGTICFVFEVQKSLRKSVKAS